MMHLMALIRAKESLQADVVYAAQVETANIFGKHIWAWLQAVSRGPLGHQEKPQQLLMRSQWGPQIRYIEVS